MQKTKSIKKKHHQRQSNLEKVCLVSTPTSVLTTNPNPNPSFKLLNLFFYNTILFTNNILAVC